MLGKAYIALGPFRLYSNFFVIERLRPIVKGLSDGEASRRLSDGKALGPGQ
jgi:hypothetical protein